MNSQSNAWRKVFLKHYSTDFETYGEDIMTSFLEIEAQFEGLIQFYLDAYLQLFRRHPTSTSCASQSRSHSNRRKFLCSRYRVNGSRLPWDTEQKLLCSSEAKLQVFWVGCIWDTSQYHMKSISHTLHHNSRIKMLCQDWHTGQWAIGSSVSSHGILGV